tara:strand:+ start:2434 stop:2835 length:402 start_codon:yes stop_codon:yes gene_type:complete
MAFKSRLKKLAAKKREIEHEQNRLLKERSAEQKRLGIHPDQLKMRKQARAADLYVQRRRKKPELRPVVQTGTYRRETPDYPSVTSTGVLVAERRDRSVYTGDKLLGISVMHKSNLVPIFSEEHAKDVSAMRRN